MALIGWSCSAREPAELLTRHFPDFVDPSLTGLWLMPAINRCFLERLGFSLLDGAVAIGETRRGPDDRDVGTRPMNRAVS